MYLKPATLTNIVTGTASHAAPLSALRVVSGPASASETPEYTMTKTNVASITAGGIAGFDQFSLSTQRASALAAPIAPSDTRRSALYDSSELSIMITISNLNTDSLYARQ